MATPSATINIEALWNQKYRDESVPFPVDLVNVGTGGGTNVVADPGVPSGGDDTATIQGYINTAASAGGGVIQFRAGTYKIAGLVIKTGVHLVGAGIGATTLQLLASSTSDGIVGDQFASLTGGGTLGGIYNWSLQNLTLDGNKANAASGGTGLKVYGYFHVLHNVHVHDWAGNGIYSEFGLSDNSTNNQNGGPEAHWSNVKSFRNGGKGIHWRGPHDSTMVNVKAYLNVAEGLKTETTANYAGAGLSLTNYHFWANASNGTSYGVDLGSDDAMLVNGQLEAGGSCIGIIRMTGSGNKLIGFDLYPGGNGYAANMIGITLGTNTIAPTGCVVAGGRITGFSTGASPATSYAIDSQYTGGWNQIECIINSSQVGGKLYNLSSNTNSNGDRIHIQVTGTTSTGGLFQTANSGGGTKVLNRGNVVEYDNYSGGSNGTVNLDLEGNDTRRQTIQLLNSSSGSTNHQSWYIDWAGSANTEIGSTSLGFRTDHPTSVQNILALLSAGGLFIFNDTATPSTPTGGGVLYVESGALKYIGSSGTITTLASA